MLNRHCLQQVPLDAGRECKKRAAVENAAQAVLDERERCPGRTLADLYELRSMPHGLRKAH